MRVSSVRHPGGAGFTLIELLVVIAIIALLVSILVPSLQAAREIARRVVCGVHMKNVGIGLNQYFPDNTDIMPPRYMPITENGATWYWYFYDYFVPYIDASARIPKGYSDDVGRQPGNGVYMSSVSTSFGPGTMGFSRMLNCVSQKNAGTFHYYPNILDTWFRNLESAEAVFRPICEFDAAL